MSHKIGWAMRQHADMANQGIAKNRTGEVSSYDPGKFAVKVRMVALGDASMSGDGTEESGWIPLDAVGVGNGFGMASAPNIGDMVEIAFTGGSTNAPKIVGRYHSAQAVPMGIPAGETWLMHPSGSLLKFHNDGTVTVTAASTMTYTASQHVFVGPVQMDDTLLVEQQITGQGGMAISGTNSGGQTSTVSGNMSINGNVATTGTLKNNGMNVGSSHIHSNGNGGANTGVTVN